MDWHEVALEKLYDLCAIPKRAVDVFPALFKSAITDFILSLPPEKHLLISIARTERRMLVVEEDESGVNWWRRA